MRGAAGIDVSKRELAVSVCEGAVKGFANTPDGVEELLEWLRIQECPRAVCEATGGYERGVVKGLRKGGVEVEVAHPNRVRALARALGKEAKTDGLDAKVLSRYGMAFELTGAGGLDEETEALKELMVRRRQLVEQRVQERNRLEKGLNERMKRSVRRHIGWLEEEIAELDRERGRMLSSHAGLGERAALYQSVRGVGELTACVLIAHLPELGVISGRALTSLVGLAPWSRDSGRQHGRRSIRGGRWWVRRALYMAALSGIRWEGELKRFYERLKRGGKPGKVAIVAAMRKLLLQLNAVARRGAPWTEQRPSTV